MSFGKEMKDFVSAFKVGSSIADDWRSNERKDARDAKAKEDEAELKKAQDESEAAMGRRHTTSTTTPGVAHSALNTGDDDGDMEVGRGGDTERKFMDVVKTGVTSPYGLAAVAATGLAESSFKPSAAGGSWSDPAVSGAGGTAGGIMSWRDPEGKADRFSRMREFVKRDGGDPVQAQAKFFLQEDPRLIEKLNSAKSVEEAQNAMNAAWRFGGWDGGNPGEIARRRRYADQYYRQYGQQAALPTEGTPTAFAATGGLIEDPEVKLPDDLPADYSNSNDARMPRYTPGSEPKGALPVDEAPAPAKSSPPDTSNSNSAREYLTDPDLRNEAIDAGMKAIANLFNGGGAIQQEDPNRRAAVESFARHDDVASSEDMREADRAIDPKGELAPHLKAMARLNGAYDFYLKKGDPKKASEVAASMLEYSRKVAMSGGATIQALIEKGNLAGAAKTAERVYDELPNGNKLEMKPTKDGSSMEYKVFDIDGTPTDGGRMAINEFMRLATGLQDGTGWFQAMGYYGGLAQQRGGGKGNRLATRGGNGRAPAAPRTTATERAATAEAAGQAEAATQRQQVAANAAGALDTNRPDLTPDRSNAPMNAGALPPELATVGAIPESGAMVQPSEFAADNNGKVAEAGQPSIPYNAGTGIQRVMPTEGQSTPGELERSASDMATSTERTTKAGQVEAAAKRDEALAAADRIYKERTNRKGVRTTDSTKQRTEAMTNVEKGFMGGAMDKDGEPAKMPGDKRLLVSGLAAKIMKANDIDPESAGRVLKDILEKGPAIKSDGSVGPRGGGDGVFLDAAGIRQLIAAYGSKAPSVKDVDTSLTPRNYKMPSPEASRRSYSDKTVAQGNAIRDTAAWRRNSEAASKLGSFIGKIAGETIQADTQKGKK